MYTCVILTRHMWTNSDSSYLLFNCKKTNITYLENEWRNSDIRTRDAKLVECGVRTTVDERVQCARRSYCRCGHCNYLQVPAVVLCLISSLTRSLSVHSAYNTRNGCSMVFIVYNYLCRIHLMMQLNRCIKLRLSSPLHRTWSICSLTAPSLTVIGRSAMKRSAHWIDFAIVNWLRLHVRWVCQPYCSLIPWIIV